MLYLKAIIRDNYVFYSETTTETEIKQLISNGGSYIESDDLCDNSIRFIDGRIVLLEWKTYKVMALDGAKLSPEFFVGIGVYYTENFGVIKVKNRLGIVYFDHVELEVGSKKITKSQYERMVNVVNGYISSLTYDYNQSTMDRIKRDRSKRTDIDYHIYLLVINALKTQDRSINILTCFEQIKHNPHRVMRVSDEYVGICETPDLSNTDLSEVFSGGVVFRPCAVSNRLSKKIHKNKVEYVPSEIKQEVSYDSYDNNENRFVKFFFEYCLELIEKFQTYFMSTKDFSRHNLIEDNQYYIGKIRNILNNSFLRQVGELRMIPAQSTVLTKKDGYRQIYKLFVGLKSIPETAAEHDLFEMIENKSIDVIYENYCFFIMADILSSIYEESLDKKRFRVNKSRFSKTLDKNSYSNYFEYSNKAGYPKVRLHYNKNYAGETPMESYSKNYDPDISLEIFDENDEIEKIYMFDSKFKASVFGDYDDEDVVKLFKFDDISKMHAYKDAIVKGLGSYVLYPGTVLKLYKEDDTFPYKGVGALPLRPDIANDSNYIKSMLMTMLGVNA